MASLTIKPPATRLKASATNNNNTSSTIKTISLVPFIDDFINTMYDKLSSNGINRSVIRQEIIALLRSKGGKANYHDENGRMVGRGNGDLNH